MDNQAKALFGAWTQAIGAVISAIGNSPSVSRDSELLSDLDFEGNVLQALGMALLGDNVEPPSLDKLGNYIESAGHLPNVVGVIMEADENIQVQLDAKGNLVQVVGEGLSLSHALSEEPTRESFYYIYGPLLEIIGNSMQALAGINQLRGVDRERMNTIGAWLHAIGSVLTGLGVSIEFSLGE
ncbi:DUF6944 family repetitive protein [Shouchella shacheensis]|uniref:DUF6944 family repetitive protein n=1 Tax=Shouchella shacheensis TaxID=1649580 RepID=UPI0007402C51|nr:hypothetical protein [Shouchella shacheensis]